MIVEENTWNDLERYRTELEHTGRKGMKWYQHIFGDYQKSAKYAKGSSDATKGTKKSSTDNKKEKADKKSADEKARAEKEAAKKEKKRQEILRSPTKLYKHRNEFTYDEIKKAMERFEWEKKLNEYSKNEMNRGADFIKTLNTYANNGINLYNTAARIVNTVSDDAEINKLPFIGNTDTAKNKKEVDKKKAEEEKKKQNN